MRKLIKKTATAIFALGFCAALRAETPPPVPLPTASAAMDPWAVLQSALDEAQISFKGLLTLTRWSGGQAQSEEARVYFSPPQRYRLEFLSPEGDVERIVVSDGNEERIQLVQQKKTLKGKVLRRQGKLMPREKEWELLSKNYDVSTPASETIFGRPVWGLTLTSKQPGKPLQKLSIDQETNVILEIKRYLPKGQSASSIRYVKFEPNVELADALFVIETASGAVVKDHGWGPRYMSLEELSRAAEKSVNFPSDMPGGFVFESADMFKIRGQKVIHARYTDGLAVVSVFLTESPVQMPHSLRQGSFQDLTNRVGSVRLPLVTTHVSNGKRGRDYYTLIGDTSQDLLDSMQGTIKP